MRSTAVFRSTVVAGFLFAAAASAQIRTVIVSPVPGNPVASGTALRSALAGISSPSASDRWLVKIEPGTYDIGNTSLPMRSYVDIEGSGIENTIIKGNGDASAFQNATILGADNAELRDLTVQALASGGVPGAVMAMANYDVSPRIYRVKFVSQAPGAWGVRNGNSATQMEECEVSVTGSGTGTNAYGIVYRGFPPGSKRGAILRGKVTVSGAGQNYGLYLDTSLNINNIRDSRFDVTGGASTYGIYANGAGTGWSGVESLNIRDTEISSAGGSSASYGIRFENGASVSLAIYNSLVWGHVAPTTYGIYTDSSAATLGIQGSSITGFTKTVQAGGNASIASTFLQGGPVTAGGWLGCIGVWDEGAVFYPGNSCPP